MKRLNSDTQKNTFFTLAGFMAGVAEKDRTIQKHGIRSKLLRK